MRGRIQGNFHYVEVGLAQRQQLFGAGQGVAAHREQRSVAQVDRTEWLAPVLNSAEFMVAPGSLAGVALSVVCAELVDRRAGANGPRRPAVATTG